MKRTAILMLCLINMCINGEYDWPHLALDPDGKYHFWWRIIEDTADFHVEVATLGWIGFGISPNGGMEGSDLIIGWVTNGNTIFHDRHAEGKFMPAIDREKNWKLLSSFENGTHTSLRFQRQLDTCDRKEDMTITHGTTRLIYAYHSEDPSSENAVVYHGTKQRGTKSVQLLNERNPSIMEPDLHYWEVKSPKALIPHDIDTIYFCTIVKRPELDTVNHIVKMEAIIQPGNERFVHHMVFYECTDIPESELLPYLGTYHECYDEIQTPKFFMCITPYTLWSVGGEPFYLPDHAGIPFGRPNSVYYVLEVHYDNPGYEAGIIDSSGFRITYTPNLRKHNIGMFVSGAMPYACMFIPPKQEQFVVSGHSHSACLKQVLPQGGINVIAVVLHSHLIGKAIKIRHFRGEEELLPLAEDKYYDFNYQTIMTFKEEVIVLPTDRLIMECTYDSSKREETTFGGLGTKQEMCNSVLFYYPEMSLANSMSCASPSNLIKLFGVTQMSDDDRFVVSPITGKNESFIDFVNSYPWDENTVNSVQKAMKFSPHINICTSKGNKFNMVFIFSKYPKVKKRYEKPDKCSSFETATED